MAKTIKPESSRRRRFILNVLALAICIAGGWIGIGYLQKHIERRVLFSDRRPTVILKNRPAWMSDVLAEQIAAGVRPIKAHSAFDHQMLVDINATLKANPWV